MRSIADVLRQKESQAEKLREEIEKLREAARILEQQDDGTLKMPEKARVQKMPAPDAEPAKSWP